MTELAIPVAAETALTPLGQWAIDASEAHKVASALAKTSFIPKAYQGKPAEVTACILAGQELGLDPMTSLRSIVVIQGTPAVTAVALRALVQAQGHEVWLEESTNVLAVACGKRKGSEQIHRSIWSIDRAKQLGLTGKDNWQKQPTAMLVARATSEVARLVAADAILGLAYSIEELSDQDTETKAKKARRATVPVQVDAPELEAPADEPAAEVAPIEVVDAPTLDGGAA